MALLLALLAPGLLFSSFSRVESVALTEVWRRQQHGGSAEAEYGFLAARLLLEEDDTFVIATLVEPEARRTTAASTPPILLPEAPPAAQLALFVCKDSNGMRSVRMCLWPWRMRRARRGEVREALRTWHHEHWRSRLLLIFR